MPTIQELSRRISDNLKTKEKKAKNVFRILICGSYSLEEKQYLIELKNKLISEGYSGSFLMEDFEV